MNSSSALLVLEDGRCFRGTPFGASDEVFGELVFTTAMAGYQETLTDPSFHRQIVISTAPHVGNTGWNEQDNESDRIWAAGFVVRDPAPRPSNWRSTGTLEEALRNDGVVGISGVDTRALTRHIRSAGAMRAGISTTETNPDALLARVLEQPTMEGLHLSQEVTTAEPYLVPAEGETRGTVVALDLGLKKMAPTQIARRGFDVHVLPADANFEDIQALSPDGLFYSNGPGDPATAEQAITILQRALEAHIPFFGICFGNQLFGRALGFETYKLKFGHRGVNQPVKDLTTGKVEITVHNHGFAVDAPIGEDVETAFGTATVSHVNLNDDVVEGLELRRDDSLVGFSVQYHPEGAAGPHDANYLFDRFADMIAAKDR